MSFMPNPQPGDFEYFKWSHVPDGLRGQKTSLEDLTKRFPEDENTTEISILEDKDTYLVIGNLHGYGKIVFSQALAYECKSCGETRYGPPSIRSWDDFQNPNLPPLCGSSGYEINCKGCGSYFERHTIKCS